jgi:hypothetical protein
LDSLRKNSLFTRGLQFIHPCDGAVCSIALIERPGAPLVTTPPDLTYDGGVSTMQADPYSWQTREERKRLAEQLYADGWVMERIAQALHVSQATITRDLRQFIPVNKAVRPKGGRPKESVNKLFDPAKEQPKESMNKLFDVMNKPVPAAEVEQSEAFADWQFDEDEDGAFISAHMGLFELSVKQSDAGRFNWYVRKYDEDDPDMESVEVAEGSALSLIWAIVAAEEAVPGNPNSVLTAVREILSLVCSGCGSPLAHVCDPIVCSECGTETETMTIRPSCQHDSDLTRRSASKFAVA